MLSGSMILNVFYLFKDMNILHTVYTLGAIQSYMLTTTT